MASRNFRRQYFDSLGLNDVRQRETLLENILQEECIELGKVRKIVESGDLPLKFRAEVWKLLLGIGAICKESKEFVQQERLNQFNDLKNAAKLLKNGISVVIDDSMFKKEIEKECLLVVLFLVQQQYLLNQTYLTINAQDAINDLISISHAFCTVFQNSESDAFWCFSKFLNETTKPLSEDTTIHARLTYQITYLSTYLESRDNQIFRHLQQNKAFLDQFSYRWFRSCFASIFSTDQLLRIWDKVMRFTSDFLICVAAVLIQIRRAEVLAKNDAHSILELFNHLPSDFNMDHLIAKAIDITVDLASLKPTIRKPSLDTRMLSITKQNSGGSIGKQTKPRSQKVTVKLFVHYYTQFGEALYVVGSIPELGTWNVHQSPKMTWNDGSIWILELDLKRFQPFEYKYVVYNTVTKSAKWEVTPNRKATVPINAIEIHDQWEVLEQET